MAVKLLRVGLPLLLLSVAFTAGLSLLNWVFIVRTGLISPDQDLVEFWLPGILACVLVVTLIHPRLRLLALNEARHVPLLFNAMAIVILAVPAGLAQSYIQNATGELVHVRSLAAIPPDTAARYFTATTTCIDRTAAFGQPVAEADSSGQTLTVSIFIYAPACRENGQQNMPAVWIAQTYQDRISNNLGEAEKNSRYQAFVTRAQTSFERGTMSRYTYLERVGGGIARRTFDRALRARKIGTQETLLLEPRTGAFGQRAGNRLSWLAASWVLGGLLWLVMVALAPLRQGAIVEASMPDGQQKRPSALGGILIPTRTRYALPLLLDTNILVYLAMVVSGLGVASFQTDDLIAWGGNYGPLIHGSGVFRLITSQFVHGGLMHLLNNMYGLLFAAIFLSPAATNPRLILWYLVCGLGGSLASVATHPDTVSVGASGAIFGLFGMALAFALLRDARFVHAAKTIWVNAGIFVGLNLFLGGLSPGTDNAAHVGGLATGLVLGAATCFYDRRRPYRSS